MKNIVITSKAIPVTESMRERIETRFVRLARLGVPLITPHVIITQEPKGFAIEASMTVPHGKIFAHAEHNDLYTAINDMGHKLERQLNRHIHKPHAHRNARSGKSQCRDGHIGFTPELEAEEVQAA